MSGQIEFPKLAEARTTTFDSPPVVDHQAQADACPISVAIFQALFIASF
ncbi:MAG: hypothetical protein O2983_14030 [Planctomycetota bacterium]|nr:hypothetical protein [Planctomycetota bacterium]MDA0919403.1 hypothetical protein [Planctomycetota bacterium]MDA1160722.1 hypothetical protein [Planctomycetota bacterium]